MIFTNLSQTWSQVELNLQLYLTPSCLWGNSFAIPTQILKYGNIFPPTNSSLHPQSPKNADFWNTRPTLSGVGALLFFLSPMASRDEEELLQFPSSKIKINNSKQTPNGNFPLIPKDLFYFFPLFFCWNQTAFSGSQIKLEVMWKLLNIWCCLFHSSNHYWLDNGRVSVLFEIKRNQIKINLHQDLLSLP